LQASVQIHSKQWEHSDIDMYYLICNWPSLSSDHIFYEGEGVEVELKGVVEGVVCCTARHTRTFYFLKLSRRKLYHLQRDVGSHMTYIWPRIPHNSLHSSPMYSRSSNRHQLYRE